MVIDSTPAPKEILPTQIVSELTEAEITELIRFLQNGKLDQLTETQRGDVGDYRSITIDNVVYFCANKNGKSVSSILYYAGKNGADIIIQELQNLQKGMDIMKKLATIDSE